jgi:ribosomal protein S18 acetylase RimI-like enzyme
MRAPTDTDIPTILRLVNEHAPEPFVESALRQEWDAPYIDVVRDARVEDAAYVLVEPMDDERAWIDLHGRPSEGLLDWAEGRAAETARRAFAGAWSTNAIVLERLAERRFELVRHSYRMRIDLTGELEEPVWPEGVEVRTPEPGDERVFYDVHQEAFEDTWEHIPEAFDEWAHWLLEPPAFDPELWFLACEGGEPAGVAICHPHRTLADTGWIRILGVRRPWRRRGLGRALLLNAFAEFRRRGLMAAGLGVDATSETGANRLYERAGMRVAARFDILEKAV